MAWQYGYFKADGTFYAFDTTKTSDFGDYDEYRKVFYNTETGQSLPYGDLKKGDPWADNASAKRGVNNVIEYLNTGKRADSRTIDKFIKYNGGENVWGNYFPGGPIPDGVPSENRTAGRPRDSKGNILLGYNEDGSPRFGNAQEYYSGQWRTDTGVSGGVDNPYEDALSAYYKDQYGLEADTTGRAMHDRLGEVFANQAEVAGTMADAQYQQQAMQQAQTVKQISDQVRSERMARLRAGMSESQIANQDMQMMMANVNALNEQAALANQARLEARTGAMTAQDQAYMEYLNQSNARGQVTAAMYATDAGNVDYQVDQYIKKNPGTTPAQAYLIITGQQNKGG